MAVNLSFIGGAGWQFFDDNGDPLSGGKIYTYAAGTTTPLATYTTRTGLIANTNPIILDAAGRTPQQVWATEGVLYKYVVATSTDVVIRTWDNIGGSVVASDLGQDLASTSDNADGDALIGFKQSNASGFLTGATARTVNAKLQEFVSVKDFGAVGDGVTNDYAAVAAANSAATATASVLTFPSGTYRIDTSLSFTAPVSMEGGVITGAGTMSFMKSFSAPLYYCFDCLVEKIACDVVYAEWFGALHNTVTPTSSSIDISSKAWNAWPSFINGGNYLTKQNYGDAAYLAANKPFSNADTWDFIAIQRALWSFGFADATRSGKVQLLGEPYYLSKAVRYVGDMATSMSGQGYLQSSLRFANLATHEIINFSAGPARCLLMFFRVGPTPINICGLGLVGTSGYNPGTDPTVFNCAMQNANGVLFDSCWFTAGYALFYMDNSTNGIRVENCFSEYGLYHYFGYDAGSWLHITNTEIWKAGYSETGISFVGAVYVSGCLLVSLDNPYVVGRGSHISSTTIIQSSGTTIVDGRTLTRSLQIPAGATVSVAKITMGAYNALTTDMVVGGVIQGVGGVGFSNKLSWYTDNALPVAATVSATSKWGNATAQTLVAPTITAGGTSDFSILIQNTGTGAQSYDCNVTLTIEGGDFVISGLV